MRERVSKKLKKVCLVTGKGWNRIRVFAPSGSTWTGSSMDRATEGHGKEAGSVQVPRLAKS
jgi:hypothetical protein